MESRGWERGRYLGALASIVTIAHCNLLGRVVAVLEDGDEDAANARNVDDWRAFFDSFELGTGAQVKTGGDAQVAQGGGTGRSDLRGLSTSIELSAAKGPRAAEIGRVSAEITKVLDAFNRHERRVRERSHSDRNLCGERLEDQVLQVLVMY